MFSWQRWRQSNLPWPFLDDTHPSFCVLGVKVITSSLELNPFSMEEIPHSFQLCSATTSILWVPGTLCVWILTAVTPSSMTQLLKTCMWYETLEVLLSTCMPGCWQCWHLGTVLHSPSWSLSPMSVQTFLLVCICLCAWVCMWAHVCVPVCACVLARICVCLCAVHHQSLLPTLLPPSNPFPSIFN